MNDHECLQTALSVAKRFSHDPRTQVGAVLWIDGRMHEAANCIPERLEYRKELVQPPLKYAYIEHAERAVIFKAAQDCNREEDFRRATLYAPWFACPDCARAIIAVGIKEVVGLASLRSMTPERWMDQVELGERMLSDAGVSQRWICGQVGVRIMFDGQEVVL